MSDTVRIAIRLTGRTETALEGLALQYGDRSEGLLRALDQVEFGNAALLSIESDARRCMAIAIPRSRHRLLREYAAARGVTVNVLVNTALDRWISTEPLLH